MRTCDCSSDRRRFLTSAAAGALAFRFGQRRLFAQVPAQGRRFLFIYIPGGWDQILFLDPREFEGAAGSEAAYRSEVQRTGIDTAYKYGGNSLGGRYVAGVWFGSSVHKPANARPPFMFGPGTVATIENGTPLPELNLVQLAERGVPMAIVRGMNMGTLGHEPGYQYFLTGEPAVGNVGRGTSMPIRIAAALGEKPGGTADTVTSVMAMGVQSYTGNKPGRYGAFMLQNMSDAFRMLRRPNNLLEHPQVEQALAAYGGKRRARLDRASDPSGLLRQLVDSHERTSALLASSLADRFDFLTGTDEGSRAIRSRYGVSERSDPMSPPAIAAFAAQAVKYGLAQFISVGFTKNIVDSHGGSNAAHMGGLFPCLRAITRLVDDLATTPAAAPLRGSWLDNTTILVFSEFGRTPLFNITNGRDHHFTSSCLLIGAGVRPGAVVGASTETGGMQPRHFDFAEQKVLPEGAKPANAKQRYIQPEDIGATLLASAGLDYSEYRGATPLWEAITQKSF